MKKTFVDSRERKLVRERVCACVCFCVPASVKERKEKNKRKGRKEKKKMKGVGWFGTANTPHTLILILLNTEPGTM